MGRHKAVKDPNTLWEWFVEYRKWCEDNPRIVTEFHGKDGEERIKPLKRPLTHEGFLCFCWEEKGHDVNHYYYNVDGNYTDYLSIVTRIKETIRRDQIEGGMVGQFNSNLTARLNGLVDKQEQKQDLTVKSIEVKIVPPSADGD
jgi:hypothetical protein